MIALCCFIFFFFNLLVQTRSFTVIVGGAGMSGASLACELADRGVNVVLLEAGARTGGRMQTIQLDNATAFEGGAAWVQGAAKNAVKRLAQTVGLRTTVSDFFNVRVFADGAVVKNAFGRKQTGGRVRKLFAQVSRISDECLGDGDSKFCRNVLGRRPPVDMSIGAGLRALGFRAKTPKQRALQHFVHDFEWAESPDIVSLNNSLPLGDGGDGDESKADLVTDRRGFSFLVDTLLERCGVEAQLNSLVVKVSYGDSSGVRVRVRDVVSGAERDIVGDRFVSSFSVGVLQHAIDDARAAPQFSPPLPVPLARSIRLMHMGAFQKYFFRFRTRFWPAEREFFLTDHSSRKHVGTFAPVWQSFPDKNVLAFLAVGDRARELDTLSDSVVIAQLLPVLDRMFDQRLNVNDVVAFARTDWLANPLTRGAYSIMHIRHTLADIDALRAGTFGDRRIFFTGEHTCANFAGFVHGAFEAGKRTARAILGLSQKSPCDDE